MIKILHVVSSMDPVLGGVCKAVRIIATSLIQQGLENEVVSLDDSTADFVLNETFKLHALGQSNNLWSYHSQLLPWLKSNILNYDYVIIHGLWQYNAFGVYKAFKSITKESSVNNKYPKYYVMPHGMLDPYFQKAYGRRLKAIRNWIYWKAIENNVVNNAEGLLFTCEEEKLLARKPFRPYHPKRELVVGLGVEAPPKYKPKMDVAFFSSCDGLQQRSFLLFLSRIHEKKGVDLLIKAYNNILKSNQNNKKIPALVIAGPGGDSDYGKKIKALVSESESLRHNVFFPGMLSGDAKWGAFYNCESFVLPSHQENFGIAIVEAMACCKAVLISNKVNIWREIKEGNTGFIEDDSLFGTSKLLYNWFQLSESEKKTINANAKKIFLKFFATEQAATKFKNAIID